MTSGPLRAPSRITNEARPEAPSPLALTSRSDISLRDMAAPPGIRSPLTTPPSPSTLRKPSKAHSLKLLSRSRISDPILMSGLSLPKRSMASCHESTGKGSSRDSPRTLWKSPFIYPSIRSIMSSSVMKLISISIWVNSGCRSARRSSSLKHLTIWK